MPPPATPVAFIHVHDRERALAFYRDRLGLTVRGGDDFGDTLEAPGALVRITVIPDYKPHPHPVFGWNVEDFDAAYRDLKARGIEFTIYEGMGQDADGVWTAPGGGVKVAWFSDPDGNVLSLTRA